MKSPTLSLYSRAEHGTIPVKVYEGTSGRIFQLELSTGIVTYTKEQELLYALTGKGHLSFDKYFRIGKYAPKGETGTLTVMDFFQPIKVSDESILVSKPIKKATVATTGLGIDLNRRGHEVAKLLFAGYSGYIYGKGYDPEDVLQEVYRGILIRNQGTCPWDPAKSSFGHYVHMVCGCVLNNYHRRQGRRTCKEQVGLPIERSEEAVPAKGADPVKDLSYHVETMGASQEDVQLMLRVLPLLNEGYKRSEIAEELGISRSLVTKAVMGLRSATENWSYGSRPDSV